MRGSSPPPASFLPSSLDRCAVQTPRGRCEFRIRNADTGRSFPRRALWPRQTGLQGPENGAARADTDPPRCLLRKVPRRRGRIVRCGAFELPFYTDFLRPAVDAGKRLPGLSGLPGPWSGRALSQAGCSALCAALQLFSEGIKALFVGIACGLPCA